MSEDTAKAFRVLLVDDDKVMLNVVSDMLREQGASEVITATDGARALHALYEMKSKPDLLMCDVCMPDMDGVELMDVLGRQGYHGAVVLFSGIGGSLLTQARVIAEAHGLNVAGTLEKPVSETALAAIIDRLKS